LTTTAQVRQIAYDRIGFKDPSILSKHPERKEELKLTVKKYFEEAGMDRCGAHEARVNGAWHAGSAGHEDKFSRITVTVLNGRNERLYWYRTTDKTFWDVIHVPENTDENQWIWDQGEVYEQATKEQFEVSVHLYIYTCMQKLITNRYEAERRKTKVQKKEKGGAV
jgi:hypothetical protein